jgi:hypothetical protein
MTYPFPDRPEESIHETPVEARQGEMNRWPLRILVLSTIAAAVGLGLFLIPA